MFFLHYKLLRQKELKTYPMAEALDEAMSAVLRFSWHCSSGMMNFGGKCFLGRVVRTHNNFLEMDDGRGQKVPKQERCSGTFR
jgi:hypothetical protein